jgi:hypothetical protein
MGVSTSRKSRSVKKRRTPSMRRLRVTKIALTLADLRRQFTRGGTGLLGRRQQALAQHDHPFGKTGHLTGLGAADAALDTDPVGQVQIAHHLPLLAEGAALQVKLDAAQLLVVGMIEVVDTVGFLGQQHIGAAAVEQGGEAELAAGLAQVADATGDPHDLVAFRLLFPFGSRRGRQVTGRGHRVAGAEALAVGVDAEGGEGVPLVGAGFAVLVDRFHGAAG